MTYIRKLTQEVFQYRNVSEVLSAMTAKSFPGLWIRILEKVAKINEVRLER